MKVNKELKNISLSKKSLCNRGYVCLYKVIYKLYEALLHPFIIFFHAVKLITGPENEPLQNLK